MFCQDGEQVATQHAIKRTAHMSTSRHATRRPPPSRSKYTQRRQQQQQQHTSISRPTLFYARFQNARLASSTIVRLPSVARIRLLREAKHRPQLFTTCHLQTIRKPQTIIKMSMLHSRTKEAYPPRKMSRLESAKQNARRATQQLQTIPTSEE